MKRLLLASCAIGISATSSFAAPATALPFNWTGCYFGVHGGGGWGGRQGFTDQFSTPGVPFFDPAFPVARTSGGLAGGQIGCDYQFSNNMVVGIEGSGSWANIQGSSDPFFGGKAVFSAETRWLAAATGRIGYTFNNVLFYAKGGPAWAGNKYQLNGTFFDANDRFSFVGSETRLGYTLGAGIEWAFWKNWSAKFEYAYYDFGTRSLILVDTAGFTTDPNPSRISQQLHTFIVGVNYHFWTGGTGPR